MCYLRVPIPCDAQDHYIDLKCTKEPNKESDGWISPASRILHAPRFHCRTPFPSVPLSKSQVLSSQPLCKQFSHLSVVAISSECILVSGCCNFLEESGSKALFLFPDLSIVLLTEGMCLYLGRRGGI